MSCNGGACAPGPFMFQETIEGNFNAMDGPIDTLVWSGSPGQYSQGTVKLFNSAASLAVATGSVGGTAVVTADAGFTIGASVLNPTGFTIAAGTGSSGSYCITLYKRVLA